MKTPAGQRMRSGGGGVSEEISYGVAQPRRDPAGPTAEDARNPEPVMMKVLHIVHPAQGAAPS